MAYIVFRYDPENGIRETTFGNPHYSVALEGGRLTLAANLKEYNSAPYSPKDRLVTVFNLNARMSSFLALDLSLLGLLMADAEKPIADFQARLDSAVRPGIPVEVDWSFIVVRITREITALTTSLA